MRSFLFFSTLLLGFCFAQTATADMFFFDVSLSGDQEVPVAASSATGLATALFDTSSGLMTINGSFSGLSGNATAAHLHGFADAAGTAGVNFPLTIDAATSGSFSGSSIITGDDATYSQTLNGNTYINIHTGSFPGGEIRGQLVGATAVPEPGSLSVLLIGMTSVLAVRRRRLSNR